MDDINESEATIAKKESSEPILLRLALSVKGASFAGGTIATGNPTCQRCKIPGKSPPAMAIHVPWTIMVSTAGGEMRRGKHRFPLT